MTTDSQTSVNKTVVLVISTITAFIMPFLVASVNVALPTMARELNMEAVVMTWVGTIYFLAIAIVQVPFGRLADILGRRKLFLIGISITVCASLMGGLANSVPLLLISRTLQGLGAGITFNNSIAILTSVYPNEERGKALGISMAGTYLGLALGPLLGGLLTENLGWRSIFFTSSVLGMFLIVLVYIALKGEWREAHGEKFDAPGSIIYGIAIALFMYGFSTLASWLGLVLFVLGAIGLVIFIRWEMRIASPIFQLSLFRNNRIFLFSNLAVIVTYLSTFAVNYLLSLYLQYIKGMKPDAAGLVMVAASVLMTAFTPISGRISDKVEPRLVAGAGMLLNFVALVLFIFIGNDTPTWYIILALALYGTGIGLFSSPNSNAIMGAVEKKSLGVASGILGTMRTAGMMLSMGIVMVLFSLYNIGDVEITTQYYPDFLSSVRVGFIVFSVLGFGGLLSQLLARTRRASASFVVEKQPE